MTPAAFYRLDLTPHERAALLTVVSDYMTKPDAVEVSIDAASGGEIEIGTLLKRLLDAPLIREER